MISLIMKKIVLGIWRYVHSGLLFGPRVQAVAGLPGGLKFDRLLIDMENLQDVYRAAKIVWQEGKSATTSGISNYIITINLN
jgi:hypothetical protein